MTQPYVYIEPPVVEPYQHGLLAAAAEITPANLGDGTHWTYGGVEWQSIAAFLTTAYPGALHDAAGAGGAKVLPVCTDTTKAGAFAVYGGVAAGSVGRSEDDHAWWLDRARRIVELAGQYSVEAELWAGGAGSGVALNAAGTPLAISGQANTTVGAVDLVTAIAALEAYLAANYRGRGIIHAPRHAAPHLAQLQQIKHDPDNPAVLTTPLGTRFSFGAGYDGSGPAAVAPPASPAGLGYFYMYCTGAVVVSRGEIMIPASFGEALNRLTNQVTLLAEQTWLTGVDGAKAGVLAKTQTIN